MKNENNKLFCLTLGCFLLLLSLFSCSTTKHLGENEILYVGVKKMDIKMPDKVKLNSTQSDAISSVLSVKPNNPLYSPYMRTPLPIGLWVHNWNIKKEKGLKWWLYNKLSAEPKLISGVQPDLRLKMVENNMKDFGFYGTDLRYEVIPKRHNPKKAKVSYYVELPYPFKYNNVVLWGWDTDMKAILDKSMRFSEIKKGEQYDVNLMEAERQRISNRLRNKGYYFFKPDYVEFLIDTTAGNKMVDVRIALKREVPGIALKKYKFHNVDVDLTRNDGSTEKDTIFEDGVRIIYEPPITLKPNVIARAVRERPGQIYSSRRQSRTQSNFVQLGVFKFANVTINAADSIFPQTLDMKINGEFALPIETEIEMDVSSKSNNLLGPGLILGITNRNMFKRAETFSVKLNGSYEWQVGGKKQADGNSGLVNSYELGLNFNLSVPRLLLPKFMQFKKDRQERTQFQVGIDLMNRHNYFRMISFWGSAGYDFNTTPRHCHSVTPFKLNYTYLLKTSPAFDSVTMRNPTVAKSFSNQFIPSMSYSYTYDRPATYRNPNRLFWQTSFTQAGNIIAGCQKLFGNKQKEGKHFINNIYSQFIKLTTELIGYKTVNQKNQLAVRLMGGIGYAYGNSKVLPYSEQFYIGGANSIRAFQVRTIGPGSYHPVASKYSYLDQTGDIKFEANLEYRFTIYENLKGAMFVDAGNVWLLRGENQRPGGEFSLKGFGKELALGTGLGVRYDFSFIVVRADLGIPIHAPYDTGKSGYYNISDKFGKGLVLNIAIGYPF